MSDLVERLRFKADCGVPDFTNSRILDEAADRIEALEAALREIITLREILTDTPLLQALRIARTALAPEQDR